MGRQFTRDESALPTRRLFPKCANEERYCWERRIVLPSHISPRPQRATRGVWSIRRAEAPAGRQPPSRRGWCRSLSEPRPRGRCCGRLHFVALPDSSPAMVFSRWRVCFLSQRAWIRSGSSQIHQPICSRSGSRWGILPAGERILLLECLNPCPSLSPQWLLPFKMHSRCCEALALPSSQSISPECLPNSPTLRIPLCSTRVLDFTSSALTSTAPDWVPNLWT